MHSRVTRQDIALAWLMDGNPHTHIHIRICASELPSLSWGSTGGKIEDPQCVSQEWFLFSGTNDVSPRSCRSRKSGKAAELCSTACCKINTRQQLKATFILKQCIFIRELYHGRRWVLRTGKMCSDLITEIVLLLVSGRLGINKRLTKSCNWGQQDKQHLQIHYLLPPFARDGFDLLALQEGYIIN